VLLTDGDRIRNLLAEYCDLVDAGDLEGVGLLMADASLHTLDGTEIARGAEGVTTLYRSLVKLHEDGTPRTQHLVSNVHLTPLDDGTVKAQSVFVVLQATDTLPLQPVITGRYVDVFAPTADGGWRFSQRAFGPALTGNLTEHMEIELS
jgi:ketosteroid isomerase-like protein